MSLKSVFRAVGGEVIHWGSTVQKGEVIFFNHFDFLYFMTTTATTSKANGNAVNVMSVTAEVSAVMHEV